MSDFLDRLEQLKIALGWTQNKFSRKTGVAERTLIHWKKNPGETPKQQSLIKIANGTGCNFYWLEEGKGDMFEGKTVGERRGAEPSPPDFGQNADLIKMAKEILDSNTIYGEALASDIRAFHHALKK